MVRPWTVLVSLLLGLVLCACENINQTQLEQNEQAQAEGQVEEETVISHVVEGADPVELQRWVNMLRY